eukprot:3444434-Amphidinium_carterae.1
MQMALSLTIRVSTPLRYAQKIQDRLTAVQWDNCGHHPSLMSCNHDSTCGSVGVAAAQKFSQSRAASSRASLIVDSHVRHDCE